MQRRVTVWVGRDLVRRLALEATVKTPLETGGILAGYWSGLHEVVVTAASGPGPAAEHTECRFKPDTDHHDAWMKRTYAESAGVNTYLGDWHTHPGQDVPHLSPRDTRTLTVIANDPTARAARPLMIVLAGEGADWHPYAWIGERRHMFGLLKLIQPAAATVSVF